MKTRVALAFILLPGLGLGGPGLSIARAQAQEAPLSPTQQSAPPMADRAEGGSRSERSQQSSSLSDAVRRVQRETGGQVLGAERIQYDGREINRIKVIDRRGRVRSMDDDPQRGPERSPVVAPPARDDNR